MRKLLFSTLVVLSVNAIAQTPAPPPAPDKQDKMRPEFIVPIQIGTEKLKNGEDTVKLTDQTVAEMHEAMADPQYTVLLTPRGDDRIFLAKTSEKYFMVKQPKGSAHSEMSFDYVVFVKQKRPMMPMRPQHPPMPPRQNPTPQQPPAPPAEQK